MAEEQGIRPIRIDPSALVWLYPAEAIRKLDALATLARIGRRDRGSPLPGQDRLRTLGRLLDRLFPDGSTERLPETAVSLDPSLRAHLAYLLRAARADLQERQASSPSIPLGFPDDTRGIWANLLDRGWIPMQPGWIATPRR